MEGNTEKQEQHDLCKILSFLTLSLHLILIIIIIIIFIFEKLI